MPPDLRGTLRRIPILRTVRAWQQWLLFPALVRVESLRDHRLTLDTGRPPLPPPALRYRVHGRLDARSFLAVGDACADDLFRVLTIGGVEPSDDARVLDFGTGCGRVLRHLVSRRPGWRITGTDIDPEAVAWCRSAFPSATFAVTPWEPPTDLPDATFDLVLGISVFTHLDRPLQEAWLVELARVTRPGGWILLTVHGATAAQGLPPEGRAELEARGTLFRVWRTGRLKLDGLPDGYQTAYHTRDHVQREWTLPGLEVHAYLEAAVNGHQDAVLLCRTEASGSSDPG
jgi:SAM-dependent methyltransferase